MDVKYRHNASVNSHGDQTTSHNSCDTWLVSIEALFFLCGLGFESRGL